MLRLILVVNAVALNVYRYGNYEHPVAGLACVLVMVAWTAVAGWAYADVRRRGSLLLGLDLAITVGLLLLTPVVKGPGFNASITGFWTMAALLAWAVHWRWLGGLVAGIVLAGVDLAVRPDITQANIGNAFLLLIGGPIVGYMCWSLQEMATERDRAEREAAAAAERARLARAVHDGVLQVLSLVQRRGREVGGELGELGRLAGQQESALRTLIHRQDTLSSRPESPEADLVSLLGPFESRPEVTVVTPAHPVTVPTVVGAEIAAAVAACLDNVARHVGEDAPAWVLLDTGRDRIEISVRDDGPGIPAGRLVRAEQEGRLGVAESIRGRIEALGGTAELSTGDWGTEWRLAVPTPTGTTQEDA